MFTPWGTARRRFDRTERRDDFERCIDALRPGCAKLDLGEESLVLLAETVLRSELSGRDREAFLLLLAVSLWAVNRGSTRLPLNDPQAEPWIDEVLHVLLSGDAEPAGWKPDEALKAIRRLAGGGQTRLIGSGDAYVPFILEGGHFYHQRMRHLENNLVARFRQLMARERTPIDRESLGRAFGEVVADHAPLVFTNGKPERLRLEPEQQYALLAVAEHPVCVISGGPGTGKTTLVVALLRLLVRLGVAPEEIWLTAPTGKAAYRMGEAVSNALKTLPEEGPDAKLIERTHEPMTLHRLLGYSPAGDRFRHDENHVLAAKVVIVDESSMVDLFLMERLLRALPGDARLVLIGDAHQLPSVEAGAVLRDLMVSLKPAYRADLAKLVRPPLPVSPDAEPVATGLCAVLLRKQQRAQSGTLLEPVADRIKEPSRGPIIDILQSQHRVSTGDVSFRDVEWVTPEEGESAPKRLPSGLLSRWYEERIASFEHLEERLAEPLSFANGTVSACDQPALDALFAHVNGSRILCLSRVFSTGSLAINQRLHDLHGRRLRHKGARPFYMGEPVLMLRNDYTKNIFNGDQGIILMVTRDQGAPHLAAVFQRHNGYAEYPVEMLAGSLEHSYAMTVHKSQGSEYRHIMLVFPHDPSPLVTREIFYTGLTRAKQSALIVGSPGMIRYAVDHPGQRFTGVGEKLRVASSGSRETPRD